jgi:hypothetical protein
MAERKAHQVWLEQCEAVKTIKARFGLKAAFDYIVGEKLLNFAEASVHNPDFARELPRFVSEVRRMFATEEIKVQLADIERTQSEIDSNVFEDDDPLQESPEAAAERASRLNLIKQLLTAAALGTS